MTVLFQVRGYTVHGERERGGYVNVWTRIVMVVP